MNILVNKIEIYNSLEVSQVGNDLQIGRNNGSSGYYMMISKQPVRRMKFLVTILGIYSGERFLDMGLVTEEKKIQTDSNLYNSYCSSGNYSYYGYAHYGMTGKVMTSSGSIGLEKGNKIYIEFDGKKLDIYSSDRKTDLTVTVPSGNYYLFFVL